MNYAIKAYGDTQVFKSKAAYRRYLMEWIRNTEGAEQDRAVMALEDLEEGVTFTDTDPAGQ